MQKKFLSNLLLIVILNLLVKPLAIFGIDAGVQNQVGTEAYGLYFSLLSLSFLFNIVNDLGINNFTTKNIAQYPTIATKYFGKIFSFRLILFFIYSIVTLSAGFSIGYRGESLYLLSLLVFNQLLATLIAYLRSHFGGLHLFKTDAFISVMDRLLLILICGSILYFSEYKKDFTIEWFILIQTVCYGITFLIAFVLLSLKIGIPTFKLKWAFSLAILRKSFPYALLILLMMVYTRTDSIMLERIHPRGSYEAGIYAKGFRLLDAFFMFGMIFANLLLPVFSRLLKQNNTQVLPILNTSKNMLIGGAILIAFVCQFNGPLLLRLIYHSDISETIPSFQLIMWGFIGMSTSLIYSTLLTAKGDLSALNKIALIGILLNVVFNALLIPQYGAAGSAFATLITQSGTALFQVWYCSRIFNLRLSHFDLVPFGIYIGFMTTFSCFAYSLPYFFPLQLLLGIVGLILLKLIDIRGFIRIFKQNL